MKLKRTLFISFIKEQKFNFVRKFNKKIYFSPITKGTVTPARNIPENIHRPDYATIKFSGNPSDTWFNIEEFSIIKNDEDLRKFKRACQIAAEAARLGCLAATEGSTTDDIDKVVHDYIISQDAYPTPVNYHGFPKSVCTSVNEGIFNFYFSCLPWNT